MKKRNIKLLMSFIMIFAMIFTSIGANFINPYVVNAEGNNTEVTAKIAVVGKYNEVLFSPQEITVSNAVYVSDILKATGLEVKESDAGFVTSIGDFENGAADDTYNMYSGWMYTINDEQPDDAPSRVKIKEGDKIFFYYVKDYTDEFKWNNFIDVNVRVENKNDTILENTQVTVLKGKSVLAAIKEALNKKDITSDIDMSGTINKINEVDLLAEGFFWGYTVNDDLNKSKILNKDFGDNCLDVDINSGDEIVVYPTDMATIGYAKIEIDKTEVLEGQSFTVTISKDDLTMTGTYQAAQGVNVHFDGKEYKTDENGQVTIIPEKAGEYEIYADGEGIVKTDKKKIIVKEAQKIRVRVEGKDNTLCDKEVSITDEKTALDILKKAVDGQIGFNDFGMINEICGEKAEWGVNQAYWGLYIIKNNEISEASKGANEQTIDGVDEILFHVNKSTGLPVLEYKQDGDKQKIIVKSNVWGNIHLVKDANIEINGQKYTTDDNGEVVVELPEGEYIATVYKNNDGEYPELIKCAQKLSVNYKNIKILLDLDMLTVGSTLNITAKVFNQEDEELKDETVKWYTSNPEIATIDENTGIVKGIKEGKVTITGKLASNETITASIDLFVEEKITNKVKINKGIDDLRKHYNKDNEFNITKALSYKATSNNIQNDLEIIKEKYKISSNLASASEYANAIIGLIALGEDPRDYKGKDYVNELVQLQKEDGKFILGKYDDYPTVSAISIIALDMAKADYRVEDAVKALMSYQNDDGTFGPFKDIDTLAMSIKGLYNHKDVAGVKECINKAVEKLLDEKENIINKNANTLATVIQGLISVGENPLTNKWTVDGKTMLNCLFKYKNGDTFGNDLATEQVFAALADLYKKESMYTGAKINNEGYDELFIPVKEDNTEDSDIKEGDKATISIEGVNHQYIISKTDIDLENGDTVFSVTKRILDNRGISFEEDDGYFVKINGLGERDKGVKSGWMYNVNGVTVSENSKDCHVKNGDKIEWFYTLDYTTDSRNTSNTNSEVKDELDKQIDNAKNIIDNKNATESEVTKAVKDITDQLNKKVEKINSKEDAKSFVKDIKDIAKVMDKAAKCIKTEDGAKDLANESVNIVKGLSKITEKLKEDSEQKDIAQAAAENMKTILNIMDKIKDVKEINKITVDMLEAAGTLMKEIEKDNSEAIKEKVVEIAKKAVDLVGTQTFEKKQLKTEKDKVIAKVTASKIKDLSKNIAKTIKKMQESLNKNNIKETFEKRLTIAVAEDTNKEIEVNLPSDMIKTIKENGIEKVEVNTQTALFNVTPKTFGEGAEDKEIVLSAKKVDRKDLSALTRHKIPEDSIIVDLSAKVGEEKISNFNEPMIISIPYKGKIEKGKEIEVFYLSDNGTIEPMGGEYDKITKMITFKTEHFSKYFAKKVDKEMANTFRDLQGYDWAKKAVEVMANKGIISGRSKDVFDPSSNITRAEFATLITKMLKYKGEEEIPFKDIDKNQWYYSAVAAAYKNGLISGRSETVFDPNGSIKRQEMAVIISKVLNKKGYEKATIDTLNTFKDKGDIASWARNGVSLCVKTGIISGIGDGKFAPTQNANRAQAAVMLYKLYNLIMK
ncbi:S-layer homology domain-containing protein [Crassaminicella indica]|uniref:S-layer homology domain-containing protein n=1 Tax=Crassaminicella indica TaxID=2855394 RepID=A0ABX8R8A8_9CLOT|nr:S-layer homology domain-containing protein [Crassaminicella indica]QXM05269.1 S-layer homology domain-containing protein [Crassaminicella indica]